MRLKPANVIAARAAARQSDAGLYPTLTGQASATRSNGNEVPNTTASDAGLDASWELDLFAKAASQSKADRARATAEEFTYAGAYVSLSSEVADYYVQYRACREIETIYRTAVKSQNQILTVTRQLAESGFSPS